MGKPLDFSFLGTHGFVFGKRSLMRAQIRIDEKEQRLLVRGTGTSTDDRGLVDRRAKERRHA